TGEVDSNTVDRLRELLHCRLRSELHTLELNLSRVSFLSIDGAPMLARAAALAQYWQTELLVVTTGSRAVRRVRGSSGLDRQLPIGRAEQHNTRTAVRHHGWGRNEDENGRDSSSVSRGRRVSSSVCLARPAGLAGFADQLAAFLLAPTAENAVVQA